MPKIKKWNDTKKVLPVSGKTCLIKTGDYDYKIATLEAAAREKEPILVFRDWSDSQGSDETAVQNVRCWAYIELK